MIVVDASAMVEALIGPDARHDLFALAITRHATPPLEDRIWQLRHQFMSHDATSLALAEALDAPLYTCDGKLAGPGHEALIRVVPRSH